MILKVAIIALGTSKRSSKDFLPYYELLGIKTALDVSGLNTSICYLMIPVGRIWEWCTRLLLVQDHKAGVTVSAASLCEPAPLS